MVSSVQDAQSAGDRHRDRQPLRQSHQPGGRSVDRRKNNYINLPPGWFEVDDRQGWLGVFCFLST
jgi:hypothetical protein